MALIDSAADPTAARSVIDDVIAAWNDNDADAFAAAFTDDGTMALSGDRYVRGREEIRSLMRMSFAGPLRGTRLVDDVVDQREPVPGAAVVTTDGGILLAGETEVAAARALRSIWVLARRDGKWLIAAFQNGRRADGPPPLD